MIVVEVVVEGEMCVCGRVGWVGEVGLGWVGQGAGREGTANEVWEGLIQSVSTTFLDKYPRPCSFPSCPVDFRPVSCLATR